MYRGDSDSGEGVESVDVVGRANMEKGGEHEGVELGNVPGKGARGASKTFDCGKLGEITQLSPRVSLQSNWGVLAVFLLAKTFLVLLDQSISYDVTAVVAIASATVDAADVKSCITTSAAARTVDIAWWVTATAASIEAATVVARSLTPNAVVLCETRCCRLSAPVSCLLLLGSCLLA
jgi:hypothetical protein